jgi:outer membrane protein W
LYLRLPVPSKVGLPPSTFLSNSFTDHYSIWPVQTTKKICKRQGGANLLGSDKMHSRDMLRNIQVRQKMLSTTNFRKIQAP